MHWRSLAYDANKVREQKTLSLVYFRSWYDPACTRFEDVVLKDPAVVAATRAYYCIMLDYASDEKLARSWGLFEDPCFAAVTPDGDVYARGDGAISAAELTAALNEAQTRFANSAHATTSAPATAPAAMP